jgi:L-threonylcarbamoyladenylate synthase
VALPFFIFSMTTIIGIDISQAQRILIDKGLVAIPTETVYGLAGNALDARAVAQIFEVKNRPSFDPLIVHTHTIADLEKWVVSIPDRAYRLFEAFSPGPLTILLPKNPIIPDLVTAGLPKVAIRIPKHPMTLELLRGLDFPLAAPSANPFGYISPTSAQHVAHQLSEKIPYILDGGSCRVGLESTIIGFEDEDCIVYRLGGLSIEDLEQVVGSVQLQLNQSSNPSAPGMLKSHYAPRKPFRLGQIAEMLQHTEGGQRIGILSLKTGYDDARIGATEWLSEKGDMLEAAQNLFAAMRRLDAAEIDLILAETMPEQGLGKAINDRMKRAAAL